ncbi:COP9 signalosome complex subunit 1 [Escovopsis weberi]|uniref:COP9 signalosome complex subunit 1 n=1 Tax=Escovopsis weberi TaxID=150374 RepID=A0A0N0RSY3_ESCWE|nr:COP9 signalosome complex subunit 1 [Escovopsis weberi]
MAAALPSGQGSSSQPSSLAPITITDLPRLDIDSYISNYSGRTRFDRLMTIGKTCVSLRIEAFKAAVHEAKNGSDVGQYKEACHHLHQFAPGEPEAERDEKWIEETESANKQETSRLESELKGYRNNLIKESIRMGNEDLGKHYEKIGKLAEATEAYTKMRNDASTTKHIVDCGLNLARVALQCHDWTAVVSNIGKVANVPSGDDEQWTVAYTKIISGVALMRLELYHDAAKHLIQTNSNADPATFSHVASPSDIAIYGGLLALATMDRQDIQAKVLDNPNFRVFLENEPIIRKALALFVSGRYSGCLELLESVRPDYSLDFHLQPHLAAVYGKIRAKCIVQYLIPYSCVTLESLDATFSKPGESIEAELVGMIRGGSLRARIDTKNKLLVADRPDPRLAMQTNALGVARKYEHEARERLRRMNLIVARLEVCGTKRGSTDVTAAAMASGIGARIKNLLN